MKFKSRKPKPKPGMEMSVTLMMPADHSAEQNQKALLKFFEVVNDASNALGSVWLRINCRNIPEELEVALQGAFDKMNRRPNLSLVIDNDPATPTSNGKEG